MGKVVILGVALCLLILLPVSAQEQEHPQSIFWSIFFNILPGFGVGSFTQGDRIGGTLQLCAELIGGGMMAWALEADFWALLNVFSSNAAETSNRANSEAYLLPTGAVIVALSELFGIIRPFWYVAENNAKHRVSFGLAPAAIPSAGHRDFDVGIKLYFALII
jgi:hypothetical protein